ncbi:MAG: 16S rRNA (cytosine(967)-C(5))-methyltransferase RsmB [Clostridiaceae bacterium]
MDNFRKIAVNLLDKVFTKGGYSNIVLNNGIKEANIDDKDIPLLTEIFYGTIKYKYTIDKTIAKYIKDLSKLDNYITNLLRISFYQIIYLDKVPSYAVVDEAVKIAKKRSLGYSKLINGVLRNYLRDENKAIIGSNPIETLSLKYSFSPWMVKLFINQYGEEIAKDILEGLNKVPTITIRVNSIKTNYNKAYEELKKLGYSISEGSVCPEAISIHKGRNIENNPLFKAGDITVQDESAMLVAPTMDLTSTNKVLDLCSAPGGKTTHMAELMENQGEIYAFDVHEKKLKLINSNAKRLGIDTIKTGLNDARKLNTKFINSFDRILIDVPCSGLGIIRKKPEIKWDKTEKDLQGIIKIQREILESTSNYLKEDGIMIYSTCTLNKKENEDNITWFLNKHKEFYLDKLYFGEKSNLIYSDTGYLTILPNENMDGFFIAKLHKRKR